MLQSLMRNFLPLLLKQFATYPDDEKRKYAQYVGDLLVCYAEGEREQFEWLLHSLEMPAVDEKLIIGALWAEKPVEHQE